MVVRLLSLSLMICVFWSFASWGQNLTAKAVGDYPYVYSEPDFNAPVLTELERGKTYSISSKKFADLFYRILVKPGVTGYVSDSEVKIISGEVPASNKSEARSERPKKIKNQEDKNKTTMESARKPFPMKRYRGFIVEQMNYSENTMGKTRFANLTFFGFRIAGNNTLFSGEMPTDTSILFYYGAPKYYEEITGQPATGWILHTDFTFDTLYPQGKNHLVSVGFGPMFKYSHFLASIKNPTGDYFVYYPMDDMTLGVLIRLGLAFRIKGFALKSDIKYYIETQKYFAYNLSLLYEF